MMRKPKTTAELILTWDMSNLIEYRDVMTEKLNDYKHEDSMTKDMYADFLRTSNNLVVVKDEIKKRKK